MAILVKNVKSKITFGPRSAFNTNIGLQLFTKFYIRLCDCVTSK